MYGVSELIVYRWFNKPFGTVELVVVVLDTLRIRWQAEPIGGLCDLNYI